MAINGGKQPCLQTGCRNWAMKDDSGLCYSHNPSKKSVRHNTGLKNSRQLVPTDGRVCSVEGCKRWCMRDGSGFCFMHNPAEADKRRATILSKMADKNINRPEDKICSVQGCKGWAVADGSKLCFWHNPELAEKREITILKHAKTRRTTRLPADRRCKQPGCRAGAIRNNPTGFCSIHYPKNLEKLKKRMRENKYTLGRHIPWLGLANIEEARGLLFYSLETGQPLLTLRALTKIASLHHLGQMTMPEPPLAAEHSAAGRSLAEEYKALFLSSQEEKGE